MASLVLFISILKSLFNHNHTSQMNIDDAVWIVHCYLFIYLKKYIYEARSSKPLFEALTRLKLQNILNII